jgi:hypothetical protein
MMNDGLWSAMGVAFLAAAVVEFLTFLFMELDADAYAMRISGKNHHAAMRDIKREYRFLFGRANARMNLMTAILAIYTGHLPLRARMWYLKKLYQLGRD